MGSLRFHTSLIMVCLFLLHALNSLAHANQGNKVKVANNFDRTSFEQKGTFEEELVGASNNNNNYNDNNNQVSKETKTKVKLGGRKMIIQNNNNQVIIREDDNKFAMKKMKKAPMNSGASKVNYEVNDHNYENDHHGSSKLDNEAFSTSDYRGPRSNPSKHH